MIQATTILTRAEGEQRQATKLSLRSDWTALCNVLYVQSRSDLPRTGLVIFTLCVVIVVSRCSR